MGDLDNLSPHGKTSEHLPAHWVVAEEPHLPAEGSSRPNRPHARLAADPALRTTQPWVLLFLLHSPASRTRFSHCSPSALLKIFSFQGRI